MLSYQGYIENSLNEVGTRTRVYFQGVENVLRIYELFILFLLFSSLYFAPDLIPLFFPCLIYVYWVILICFVDISQ